MNSDIFKAIPAGCHKCENEAARECAIDGVGYKVMKVESANDLAHTEGKHEPKGKGEGDSATKQMAQTDKLDHEEPTVKFDPKVYPVRSMPEVPPVSGEVYHGVKTQKGMLEKTESALEPKGKGESEGDLHENGEEDSLKGSEASVVKD